MKSPLLPSLARGPLAAAFLAATTAFAQPAPTPHAGCKNCGVVENVHQFETKGEAPGVGAVAGGVIGGVIGHQFGSGRGNTAATIAGAGAGAYAGHQIEKGRNKKSYWSVAIKMDSGAVRTFTYGSKPAVREGERVKLIDGGKRLALVTG